MMTNTLSNYKERYFEYKSLTKVHGRPTIDTILTVYKQLKRNAQCVPTTLGGGQLGYLALIISPVSYARIPRAAAFIRPTDPGVFTLTTNPVPPPTRANPRPVAGLVGIWHLSGQDQSARICVAPFLTAEQ